MARQFILLYFTFSLNNVGIFGQGGDNPIGRTQRADGWADTQKELETIALFDDILVNYDKRIRPGYGSNSPVRNTVQIYLASFDSLEETKMTYSITIYLRQQWNDPRLAYDDSRELPSNNYLVDKIWVPDLMFGHERKAVYHELTVQNRFVNIDSNGTVQYNARISLSLHCEMDFHRFPMDKQQCGLEVESFRYTTKDLMFNWIETEPAEFKNENLKLPQFELEGLRITECTRVLISGNYTCIGLEFLMNRELGYYLLQTYIPSILLTVISWVSFWIDIKSSPSRVALGITSVLTMITALNGVRGDLPHVSYIKAIDVWFCMCLVFVVTALVEYAIVHYLSSNKLHFWFSEKKASRVSKEKKQSGDSCLTLTIIDKPMKPINGCSDIDNQDENKVWVRGNCSKPQPETYDIGKKIDRVCRIAFPLSFLIFNICYWSYYKIFEFDQAHLTFEE
ncbi:glycine receptor subunit alpha-2-like [Saccoglossus kowalevskii]|uniref:Gamma-aminobutyric acid receptor subunit beta n=1 Tax=Saccoglossus kowalevskii TaxID=10224 RepID=A0A0U2UNB3_SACKO|nr:PREDICTED: glycine receptor subunit alpha-2-like [Saccoglossus kowalevskii]ALR88669.1 glycine receptor subunit alpha2-like [Saccoglossus kowalevskii]